MKIKRTHLVNYLIIFYPVMYIFASIISNGIARKLSLIILTILMINLGIEGKKRKIISGCALGAICLYNTFVYGVNYVIHQDFYGYVLLLLICISFSDRKAVDSMDKLLTIKIVKIVCYLFIIGILISIILGHGLQVSYEWGTTMPLLYGPYELPHSLSYQLLVMFIYASIGWHKYMKKEFLIMMALFSILLVWTGVRSAFLILFILFIYEYCSIRKTSWKMMIISVSFICMLYLVLFTDFLYNNPIMQKTVQALSKKSGITNGRTDFIHYLSYVYLEKLTFIEKILGCSIEKLRYFMSLRYATALHAHNDILNTLIGMGAIGLLLFIKELVDFCKTNKAWVKVFLPIFILAFTNGLFMYTAFTPSIVMFLIYVNYLEKNRKR